MTHLDQRHVEVLKRLVNHYGYTRLQVVLDAVEELVAKKELETEAETEDTRTDLQS